MGCNVETDKIVLDLNRRFAVPLPEFYERRIIFWHDEEKEYADKLDEIRLENAKLVALTGSNTFAVKKMLSVDDLTSNYVVYCPISYERQEDDWRWILNYTAKATGRMLFPTGCRNWISWTIPLCANW